LEDTLLLKKTLVASKTVKTGTSVVVFFMVLVVLILAGLTIAGTQLAPAALPLALLPVAVIALALFFPLFLLYIPLVITKTGAGKEIRRMSKEEKIEEMKKTELVFQVSTRSFFIRFTKITHYQGLTKCFCFLCRNFYSKYYIHWRTKVAENVVNAIVYAKEKPRLRCK